MLILIRRRQMTDGSYATDLELISEQLDDVGGMITLHALSLPHGVEVANIIKTAIENGTVETVEIEEER